MKKNKKGFTLIELLAIIVILAIIVSVAFVVIKNINYKDKILSIKNASVLSSANDYASEYLYDSTKWNTSSSGEAQYCITVQDLVDKGLLKKDKFTQEELEGSILITKNSSGVIESKVASNGECLGIPSPEGETPEEETPEEVCKSPNNFADDDWYTISCNVKKGNTDNYNVGDTKCVKLTDFTTENENNCNGDFSVRIVNKNAPDECNGENFSQTSCGFVIEFVDIITRHNMNDDASNEGGWPKSAMYKYLNDDTVGAKSIYNALPDDLKKVIIDTKTVTKVDYNSCTYTSNLNKLYLLSPEEIYSATHISAENFCVNDRQLDYYKNNSIYSTYDGPGVYKNLNGTVSEYWLRTPHYKAKGSFWAVFTDGHGSSSIARNTQGVSPAFKIG